MKKHVYVSVAGALLLLGLCSQVGAAKYKVIDVSNGGSITGTIKFTGAPPSNPTLAITKDEDICGKGLKADYYIIAGDGALKNAVVIIENIESGKAYKKKELVAFDNNKCMFSPHVTTAVVGQKLEINNADPILHNTHLYQGNNGRTLYNLALPLQNRPIKKKIKRDGLVTVKCDAHEWMLGYVYVAKTPYVTTTDANGKFTLDDIPPGSYKVKVWHEKLGEVSKDVIVQAGAVAQLDHDFQ